MLGHCEKTTVIPPTTNEWPQNQIDEKVLMAPNMLMEKPGQELLQQQQALKCPRCDSSNTKFCYYNNYSLSQPRHFCKACKRYWTRGGTLRNVPVGGGCRKNKRIKRPASAIDAASTSSSSSAPAVATTNTVHAQSQIDVSSTSNHVNPLFYGLPTNPSEMNLSFPRFNSRVCNVDAVSGYDLQPHLDAHGLGFSSAAGDSYNQSGFDSTKQIQDVLSSYSIFGSSTSTTTSTTPSMASLLASSFHQQKFINDGGVKDARAPNNFQTLAPFEDLQISNNSEAGIAVRQVKVEEGPHRLDWNVPNCQSHIEQINLSDPFLYWNATNVGVWNDPANLGSSVTSLI